MKRKTYGKYQTKQCFECNMLAVHLNIQGVPTCRKHVDKELIVERCSICNGMAMLQKGKYGIFINCLDGCRPMGIEKYLELKL